MVVSSHSVAISEGFLDALIYRMQDITFNALKGIDLSEWNVYVYLVTLYLKVSVRVTSACHKHDMICIIDTHYVSFDCFVFCIVFCKSVFQSFNFTLEKLILMFMASSYICLCLFLLR